MMGWDCSCAGSWQIRSPQVSKFLPPPLALGISLDTGKVSHKAAYKAEETQYAEPQHPKAEYKKDGPELRDNNVELVQTL